MGESECNYALRCAALNGHVAVVRFLCELPLERGVEPGARNRIMSMHPLGVAATVGHVDVVQYLCELPAERGVDPRADDNVALRHAARGGHTAVVRCLCELPLERGVDPSAGGNEAILAATANAHTGVVSYLCQLPSGRGALSNGSGLRALHKLASAAKPLAFRVLQRLAYAVVEQAPCSELQQLHYSVVWRLEWQKHWRAVQFMLVELPGGLAWLSRMDTMATEADDSALEVLRDAPLYLRRRLVTLIARQRTWRRRGCLWKLRALRDSRRARLSQCRGVHRNAHAEESQASLSDGAAAFTAALQVEDHHHVAASTKKRRLAHG